jgi:hypothetical protein
MRLVDTVGAAARMRKKPLSSPGRSGQKRKPVIGAGAPDASKCRAVPIVDGGKNAQCITELSPKCGFSKTYGSGYFCEHPERERIIARTLAERKALDAARVEKLKKPARRSPPS